MLIGCYVASCYLVLGVEPDLFLLEDRGLLNILLVVAGITLGMYFQDMYSELRVRSRTLVAQQVSTALGVAFLLQSVLNYASPATVIPRWVMLIGSLLSLFALLACRMVFSRTVLSGLQGRRLLFLGRNETVRQIADRIDRRPELGLSVAGFLDEESDETGEAGRRLGAVSDLTRVVNETKPDQIVIGLAERRHRLPMYDLLDLRFGGVTIEEASVTYENTHHRVSVRDLRPADLIFAPVQIDMRRLAQIQTAYSWVFALIGFVLTLPVMAIVWVLVRVTSPGPALYSQTRSGLNGKPFQVLKFRSMRADAEAKTGAVWASKDDPRITPIGKWLRKLRLDELPQFINVLRGEMNMVGPRPERPEFVRTLKEQIPFYSQRLFVKPGLTGWAQINHKYGDTIEDTITKLEYDLYYIKHRTISLDLYIMFQTVKVMLLHRGAQ